MIELKLRISFSSDWHCGSGLGESHLADAVLNRDTDGIPMIPGRAVKGALREGAWRLSALGGDYKEAERRLFGSVSYGGALQQAGLLCVGPAELPEDVRAYFKNVSPDKRSQEISCMITRRARTALQDGVAAHGSLRSLECGIPGLTFISSLSIDIPGSEKNWLLPYMSAVCAAVKSLGADRSRGLGRCTFQLVFENSLEPQLPDLSEWRMK